MWSEENFFKKRCYPIHYVLFSRFLLTFLGKSCNEHMLHASVVYYSDMVSGPNFEIRKVIHNFWHQDPCFKANSGCLLGTKWKKIMDLQKCQ